MISQATIKKYKLDSESLKKLFTADKPSKKIKDLVKLVSDRQHDGKIRCLTDYKIWAAVDLAFDAPMSNSQTAIIRSILEQGNSEIQTLEALKRWGLNPNLLFVEEASGDKKKWTPNYPMLFNVTIPLVRAYLTIRLANIFNERNTTPLLQYNPSHYNSETRLLCEILTSVIESITTDYAYPATLRKWMFNALMYSVALKFPMEKWHVENQEHDGKVVIEKQGVRYIVPHVSNTYYDLNYPPYTLNTGTGCSYAGYWSVLRWGDVVNDPIYWNTDAVPHGTNWLDANNAWHNYFVEVAPCTLDFPIASSSKKETNREKMAAANCYGRGNYDSAFFIGYQFMQLVPKDWGLSDYEHNVWMKFTIGADDVIMFAETFGYRPVDYIGYDSDDGRGRNASLAQEIQPSQDMATNIFCQYISSIKRNLTNINLYNTQAVDSEIIRQMRIRSQAQYQSLNLIPFDGLKLERAGIDLNTIFKSFTFQPVNTSEILTSLNTVLSLLERTLVMSAQEIASAASHQQGNKEIEIIQQSKSNRVAYTSASIDEGIDAFKRQLVEAAKCHMDSDYVTAQVSLDIPNLDEELKKIGFERLDKNPPILGQKTVTVKGKMDKLKLTQFLARRSDKERNTDNATAQAMLTAVTGIANNQFLSSVVDPTSLVKLVEQAAKFGGADDDFKIGMNKDAVVANEVSKIADQIKQQIMEAVSKQIAEPVAQEIAKTDQETKANAAAIQNVVGILEQLKSGMQAPAASPAPPVVQPPPPLVPPLQPSPAQPPVISNASPVQ